ncbi:MAG: hypothetical protein MOIL_01070 [Candidatus Methanolliviera sp. GoM_oil]|nr:MAG: hypothetical protein MOIL_01070 [Candidatus Methanolliviera sp. GoM_oil]
MEGYTTLMLGIPKLYAIVSKRYLSSSFKLFEKIS